MTRGDDAPFGIGNIQDLVAGASRYNLCGIIAWRLCNRIRETPAGVHSTVEYIYERVPCLGTPKTSPENCRHVRIVDPGFKNEGAD